MTAASQPTTPVRLPKAVTTYSPATQDPDLRSSINTVLLREGHITKISDHLTHALSASSSDWPAHIRNHALALLRSGECNTFPALMERVLLDVKRDTLSEAEESALERESGVGASASRDNAFAMAKTNGKTNGVNGGTARSARGSSEPSLAVPRNVIEEGVRITRESLESVCEVDT